MLHAELENFERRKVYILISTVLTWAKSKIPDIDEPEIPFSEEDYRRRRPHPNFKDHIDLEKLVVKFGKTNKKKLRTYVVSTGLIYGCGENVFHYFFKAAWHNEPFLKCFGEGKNIVPTIHMLDLAAVIQNLCDKKLKIRFIIAKDSSIVTLKKIIMAISRNMGSGKVQIILKEDALLLKDVTQNMYDSCLVNLRMEGTTVKENMTIHWVSEAGPVENIKLLIQEYKKTRNLLALKIGILGPPASGKTLLAEQLCDFYSIHHILIKNVIEEEIAHLHEVVAKTDHEKEEVKDEEDEDEEEEEEDDIADANDLLESVKESQQNNNGRLEDGLLINFYRRKLSSMSCQNQGFVLDGYPKTYEQARELFAPTDEEEVTTTKEPVFNSSIMIDWLFILEAPNDFLKNRVMRLPEEQVEGTHYTEEKFVQRLALYRVINNEEDTVLNYFDELEIHPVKLDMTQDPDPKMTNTLNRIKEMIGAPKNYGLSPEELEEQMRIAAEIAQKLEEEQQEKLAKQKILEAEELQRRKKEWAYNLKEVRLQEEELLQSQSVPLRHYLMQHVMPVLTKGLIECTKVRPDDPLDYLAEFLFKNNPNS